MRNRTKLVPPREKTARARYYGLIGKAKLATTPPHQRAHLLHLARALMVRIEVETPRKEG